MSFETRNYMIFNISETSSIDFNQVLEDSTDTLRLSVDGTQTFVKWEGATTPSSVNALTTKDGPYTYSEISTILTSSTWQETI